MAIEAAASRSGPPLGRLMILEARPKNNSPVATAKDFFVGGGGGADEDEDEVRLVSGSVEERGREDFNLTVRRGSKVYLLMRLGLGLGLGLMVGREKGWGWGRKRGEKGAMSGEEEEEAPAIFLWKIMVFFFYVRFGFVF